LVKGQKKMSQNSDSEPMPEPQEPDFEPDPKPPEVFFDTHEVQGDALDAEVDPNTQASANGPVAGEMRIAFGRQRNLVTGKLEPKVIVVRPMTKQRGFLKSAATWRASC
jgi:hypothetical protein